MSTNKKFYIGEINKPLSAKEFATITELNRANFKPFLVELLPEIRC